MILLLGRDGRKEAIYTCEPGVSAWAGRRARPLGPRRGARHPRRRRPPGSARPCWLHLKTLAAPRCPGVPWRAATRLQVRVSPPHPSFATSLPVTSSPPRGRSGQVGPPLRACLHQLRLGGDEFFGRFPGVRLNSPACLVFGSSIRIVPDHPAYS